MAQLCGKGNKVTLKLLLVSAVNGNIPIEGHHPMLGLAYLASVLRKEFGNEVICKIVNTNFEESINEFKPDIVGISSVSKNYTLAKAYACIAQGYNLPVIIGGVHISFLPQTLTNDMDIAVIGEGERTIVELIGNWLNTGYFGWEIEGTAFKVGNELIINDPRELIKPLDDIPFPARDLLKIDKSAHMLTSRGCPYHCTFCSTSVYTRNQTRYASAEYVADEIEYLYQKYHIDYITIYDDLFAIDTKRVIKIQELMATKNLIGKFDMAVNIRADFITDELAEILHRMNVVTVALGVESGCQKTLDYLKCSTLKVEDNARAINILKKHHIKPYCSFIIGSPDEDMTDVLETINFIKNNKVEHYDMGVLTPFPGTAVWESALSKGLVAEDMDWAKLDFNINNNPVILSEKLSRQEIIDVCNAMATRKQKYLARRQVKSVFKHPLKHIKMFVSSRIN